MNINDLKLFEAVSYYGSFTKAAKAMFTVQSNVSARIKSLEREFGTPLFSRTSHKVELTSAGEILMAYSKKINHLVAEAKQSVGGNQIIKGQVKIGFLETMMAVEGPNSGGIVRFTPNGLQNELSDKLAVLFTGGSFGHIYQSAQISKKINKDYQFSIDQSFSRKRKNKH